MCERETRDGDERDETKRERELINGRITRLLVG